MSPAREASSSTHEIHVIGFLGTKTAYLDISLEEAKRRWSAANPEHDLRDLPDGGHYVSTITFIDEFSVYDAW